MNDFNYSVQDLAQYASGYITYGVPVAGVKASDVLTITSQPANDETVTVGGKTYTFKTTLTGAANEVLRDVDAATSLDNLKLAINAGAGAGTKYGTGTTANANVSATTNTDTQQTVEALAEGTAGNSIAATETLANGSWASATLLGGVNGDTVLVNGMTLTCVTSAPGANEFTNITELEALVEALASVNSSQDGTTVTIKADAPGTAGNAITLALGVSNAGTMAVSGATLTGGVAATYTSWFQIPEEASVVKFMASISDLTASGIVEVTAQASMDQENITDLTTLRFEANGVQTEEVGNLLTWFRFKITMDDGSAASPTADIKITAQPGTSSKEDEHEFYLSSAFEASAVAKEAPGLFYGIECTIDAAAATDEYYLFVYDAQTVPSNGATLDAAKLLMVPRRINHITGTESRASFDYDGSFKRASYGICWFIGTSDSLTLALSATSIAKVTLEND